MLHNEGLFVYDNTVDVASPTTIAGVKLCGRLMNGAYIGSKSFEDVKHLAVSSAHAVVLGSISVQPREANPGHGYWRHREQFFSLNSFGMPNGGMPYYERQLPKIAAFAHAHGKPLIANVVGFSDDEFIELIQLAQASGADLIELNLGCPNVWDKGRQERIMSYHPKLVKRLLRLVSMRNLSTPIGLKISPLPPDILAELCMVVTHAGIVKFVTATNSYPNAALTSGTKINEQEELLTGLSGRALKPISLGVVRQLRRQLPASIDIIGCGGASTINDVEDYLRAGASAVQIATALIEEGPSVFDKILFQADQT